ncbi:uncharacterized protein LOC141911346 [Tubulanus polymorphus]|uniref:uncharacterized protein LOC141911346 n=1 Tax=Tubulanus polymorphus TaxID=672921 RepID=UPI003DA5BC7D
MYCILGAGFIEPIYHNFWAGGLFLFAGIFALISCCSETTCPIVGCMVLSIFASIVALACAVLMGVVAYAASYVDDNVCIKAVNKVVDTSETLTGLADVMQGAVGGVRLSSNLPFIDLLKFLCNYIHGLRVAFCIEAVLGGVELIVAMVQYSVCCRTTCCQGKRPTSQPQQPTTIVYGACTSSPSIGSSWK